MFPPAAPFLAPLLAFALASPQDAPQPAAVPGFGLPGLSEAQTLADALMDRGLTDHGAYALLRDLCVRAPHRLAGSDGYEEATQWALAAMTAAGLENVRREAVTVPHWVRGEVEHVTLHGSPDGDRALAACALGGSVGASRRYARATRLCVQG